MAPTGSGAALSIIRPAALKLVARPLQVGRFDLEKELEVIGNQEGDLPQAFSPGRSHASTRPPDPVLPYKSSAPEILEGLLDLGRGVHDERAVTGDRLVQRLAGDQEKAGRFVAGGDLKLGTVSQDEQPRRDGVDMLFAGARESRAPGEQ